MIQSFMHEEELPLDRRLALERLRYQFSDFGVPARRNYVGFSTKLFAPIEMLTCPTSLERKYLDQYPKLENISNYKVVANVSIYLTVYSIFYFKVLLTMLFSKRQ